jgi:CRP/FNR family transcriptional regulator, cyclic AMP receptor protein
MNEVRAHLEGSPLFQEIGDPQALTDLAAAFELQRVSAGEVVLVEGHEGDAMYVIKKGRVRVEKHTPAQDNYTVTFLDENGTDFFGELALLDREQRSATVVAETDCEFLVIHRDRFFAFGDLHPSAALFITRKIARNLAERLRRANKDIATLFTALVHEVEERF